jgi:uncharacterized C2H2 Zn-finger protein
MSLKCDRCQKTFRSNEKLIIHYRNSHEMIISESPFEGVKNVLEKCTNLRRTLSKSKVDKKE